MMAVIRLMLAPAMAVLAVHWVGTGRVKRGALKQEPNGSVPPPFDPGGQAAQIQAETASYA